MRSRMLRSSRCAESVRASPIEETGKRTTDCASHSPHRRSAHKGSHSCVCAGMLQRRHAAAPAGRDFAVRGGAGETAGAPCDARVPIRSAAGSQPHAPPAPTASSRRPSSCSMGMNCARSRRFLHSRCSDFAGASCQCALLPLRSSSKRSSLPTSGPAPASAARTEHVSVVSPSCAVVATQRGTVVAAAAAAHGCMEHKSLRSVGDRPLRAVARAGRGSNESGAQMMEAGRS